MHEVTLVLSDPKTSDNAKASIHENMVCRHFILSIISNELFDIYCSYKKAHGIWSNIITKNTIKDVRKQKTCQWKILSMRNGG